MFCSWESLLTNKTQTLEIIGTMGRSENDKQRYRMRYTKTLRNSHDFWRLTVAGVEWLIPGFKIYCVSLFVERGILSK
jgi:hypothetical protein